MATSTEATVPDEPSRVRLHVSLIERPFFAGVDLEFMLLGGFLLWTAFMIFKLTLPFWIALVFVGVLYVLMRLANAKDQFFLPILIRSFVYRRLYAARPSTTETASVRPSLPKNALPS